MMCQNNINTIEELDSYKEDNQDKLNDFIRKRRHYYNKIRMYQNDPEKEKQYRALISKYNNEIKMCDDLKERSLKSMERVEQKLTKNERKNKMKKIEYIKINGYLYQKLTLSPQKEIHLTRFGRNRLQYLRKYRPIIYTNLLTSGELNEHSQMIDDEANVLYDRLIEEYKIKRNITEELKEKDQMRWVQKMNNIQKCVEEVINHQIIYV